MPVHVDEMISDVTAETPATVEPQASEPEWQELARIREMQEQIQRDRRRTAAEAFDD